MDSNLKKPIRKPHGYQPVRTRKKANGYKNKYNYDEYVRKNKPAESDMSMNNPRESKQMDKKLIRLTEQDLHRIVKESVKKIINESHFTGNMAHITEDDMINHEINNAKKYYN